MTVRIVIEQPADSGDQRVFVRVMSAGLAGSWRGAKDATQLQPGVKHEFYVHAHQRLDVYEETAS